MIRYNMNNIYPNQKIILSKSLGARSCPHQQALQGHQSPHHSFLVDPIHIIPGNFHSEPLVCSD